jgi:tetratricopeptide (TPR) repeat protein
MGDRAFRDGRYGDAVHYYAKAVELAPDEGVAYLVLGDALFATGDYHYAAYALRKALELDPTLIDATVDKREFYGDPRDYDRQIAVLELYLQDHFLDDDARLVLAANYLFGGRPQAAVELLENPFSAEVRASPAGAKVLERALALQSGPGAR